MFILLTFPIGPSVLCVVRQMIEYRMYSLWTDKQTRGTTQYRSDMIILNWVTIVPSIGQDPTIVNVMRSNRIDDTTTHVQGKKIRERLQVARVSCWVF